MLSMSVMGSVLCTRQRPCADRGKRQGVRTSLLAGCRSFPAGKHVRERAPTPRAHAVWMSVKRQQGLPWQAPGIPAAGSRSGSQQQDSLHDLPATGQKRWRRRQRPAPHRESCHTQQACTAEKGRWHVLQAAAARTPCLEPVDEGQEEVALQAALVKHIGRPVVWGRQRQAAVPQPQSIKGKDGARWPGLHGGRLGAGVH